MDVNFALTILALGLAVWGIYLATRHGQGLARIHASIGDQIAELKDHGDALGKVARSLSTRGLGNFPEYFPEIVRLIDSARHSIQIVTDIPAYGHFSSHNVWIDYQTTLLKKRANGVKIEMMCLNPVLRAEQWQKQFGQDVDWETWKRSGSAADLLKEFVGLEGLPPVSVLTLEQFKEALARVEDRSLKAGFCTDWWLLRMRVPLHFWVVDNRAAIFEFPIFLPGYPTGGIYTLDGDIIRFLGYTFEEYKAISDR